MSFMISRNLVDGNQVDLIVSFGPRNRFTINGTIFERIRCVRAWSRIGSNGRIARDFSRMKSEIVGRLTRSLRSLDLRPARLCRSAPAAPFCETPPKKLASGTDALQWLFAAGVY